MIAAICGWLSAFVLVSRRTSAVVAGLIVLLVSCNPASLTYERVASSDVIVGALFITALALGTSRRQWLAAIAGMVMAVALSIKPTAWGLFPMLLLGTGLKRHQRLRRLLIMGFSLVVTFTVSLAFRQVCIQVAANGGGTAGVVNALSIQMIGPMQLTHRLTDCIKAIFVFPRCVLSLQLGPFVLWCFALPMLSVLLFGFSTGRLLGSRTFIPIGTLVYLAICSTQATNCMRHLLPVLYLAPVLIADARVLAPKRPLFSSRHWLIIVLAIVALFALYWFHPRYTVQQLQGQLYNEYTLPAQGPWLVMSLPLIAGFLALTTALYFGLCKHVSPRRSALLAGLSFSFVWWFFNNYTVSLMLVSKLFVRNQLVFQLCLCAMTAALLAGKRLRGGKSWYLIHMAILVVFITGNSFWSSAYRDLPARHFQTRKASQQLVRLIPDNAIVIGRRATTLLRTSRARLGMTTSGYEPKKFVEKVAVLLDKYPSCPLYWLVDGDGNSFEQWDAYNKWGLDKWKAIPVATAYIPSGDVISTRDTPYTDELAAAPIHLMRVTKLP